MGRLKCSNGRRVGTGHTYGVQSGRKSHPHGRWSALPLPHPAPPLMSAAYLSSSILRSLMQVQATTLVFAIWHIRF